MLQVRTRRGTLPPVITGTRLTTFPSMVSRMKPTSWASLTGAIRGLGNDLDRRAQLPTLIRVPWLSSTVNRRTRWWPLRLDLGKESVGWRAFRPKRQKSANADLIDVKCSSGVQEYSGVLRFRQ